MSTWYRVAQPHRENDQDQEVDVENTVGRNGCIALHYYVHFLRIFSFVTRGIESEGICARSVRSRLRLCNAQPARENVGIELRVTIYVCHWSTHFTI